MKTHLKNNWYLYLIGIAIILIIIKLLKDRNAPFKLGGSFSDSENNSSSVSFSTEPDDLTIVLQNGSQGNEVRTLQGLLNDYIDSVVVDYSESGSTLLLFPIEQDGVFGSLTENLLFSITGQNTISLDEYNALMLA
jgi:hypothetical protein